jgi:hypothetical protein
MKTNDQPTLTLLNEFPIEGHHQTESCLSDFIFIDPFERYRIGNRLSTLREQRYQASYEVARDLDISSGLLHRIERGDYERFSFAHVNIFAQYYRVHPREILRNNFFGTHDTTHE